jgi:hypothetical protein
MKLPLSTFKSFYKACLVVACALALSACEVTFINPLPASLATGPDHRLVGRWLGRNDDGNPEYLRFVVGRDGELNILFDSNEPNSGFRATTLKIDGAGYLALMKVGDGGKYGYLLAKYVITGKRMKVWLMDAGKVKQAIRDGKLKGVIGNESYAGVTVTDTTEKILSFIKRAGDDGFKYLADFEKVADK